jgi:hypothetical protein
MLNWLTSLFAVGKLTNQRSRKRVAKWLGKRRRLNQNEWYELHWRSIGILESVSNFMFNRLNVYSGLDSGRMLPSDRLVEDLRFNEVCWADWDLDLVEEFLHEFGAEIRNELGSQIKTLRDLMLVCSNRALNARLPGKEARNQYH